MNEKCHAASQQHCAPQKAASTKAIILKTAITCAAALLGYTCLQDQFSLTASLESRAHKILKHNPLVDGHNDLLIRVLGTYGNHFYLSNFSEPFENGGFPGEVDLPRIARGQYGGAFWSAFLPCPADISDFSTPNYDPIVRATLGQIDAFNRLQQLYPDTFPPTPNAATAEKNFKAGKLISPLAIEGLHQIGNSYANLRLYHQLGVRYSTLTWNCHNAYADAAVLTYFSNRSSLAAAPYWGGLSPRGPALITEMNRLGMLVDLSHVSVDTMIEVLNGTHHDVSSPEPALRKPWSGSRAPPIFSHSSAYSVCPHPRNVPDAVLPLVKARNSLVMVNFNPEFISCTPPPDGAPWGTLPALDETHNTIHQVIRHIKHIGDMIGYDHVGIGTDFDGIESTPRGLEGVDKFPDLVVEMLKAGISDKDCAKVVGRNLLRVWKDADRVAAEMKAEGVLPAEDESHGWTSMA